MLALVERIQQEQQGAAQRQAAPLRFGGALGGVGHSIFSSTLRIPKNPAPIVGGFLADLRKNHGIA